MDTSRVPQRVLDINPEEDWVHHYPMDPLDKPPFSREEVKQYFIAHPEHEGTLRKLYNDAIIEHIYHDGPDYVGEAALIGPASNGTGRIIIPRTIPRIVGNPKHAIRKIRQIGFEEYMRQDTCYDLFVFIVSEMLSTGKSKVKITEAQFLDATNLTDRKLRTRLSRLKIKYGLLDWVPLRKQYIHEGKNRWHTENIYFLTDLEGWK